MKKADFLKDVNNFSNHRYLLWEALEATKYLKLPVMELGSGYGSTPFLRQYTKDNGLDFYSYDYNKEWAEKTGATHVENWDTLPHSINAWINEYSVVLIDESPGEHRKESLKTLSQGQVKIIVIHDSEIKGWNSSDYQVRPLFSNFKYMKDLQSEYKGGAWATALSNEIDVTKFKV